MGGANLSGDAFGFGNGFGGRLFCGVAGDEGLLAAITASSAADGTIPELATALRVGIDVGGLATALRVGAGVVGIDLEMGAGFGVDEVVELPTGLRGPTKDFLISAGVLSASDGGSGSFLISGRDFFGGMAAFLMLGRDFFCSSASLLASVGSFRSLERGGGVGGRSDTADSAADTKRPGTAGRAFE